MGMGMGGGGGAAGAGATYTGATGGTVVLGTGAAADLPVASWVFGVVLFAEGAGASECGLVHAPKLSIKARLMSWELQRCVGLGTGGMAKVSLLSKVVSVWAIRSRIKLQWQPAVGCTTCPFRSD
jgi:hypothetical protein